MYYHILSIELFLRKRKFLDGFASEVMDRARGILGEDTSGLIPEESIGEVLGPEAVILFAEDWVDDPSIQMAGFKKCDKCGRMNPIRTVTPLRCIGCQAELVPAETCEMCA
jgi:hypothetical protein